MRVCAFLLLLWCTLPAHGETIYTAVGGEGIRAVDTATMTSTLLVHSPTWWYDIAFAANGKLYGSDAYRLFAINTVSGQSSLVGTFGTFINGLTFVGDTLYASGDYGLYTINLTNGQAHYVGSTGQYSSGDLQWFQGALYLTAAAAMSGNRLVRVDPVTGHGTVVGEIGYSAVYGLAASASELFGVTLSGELLKIDISTGAGTRLGTVEGGVYGASSKPQEVPEPGALLLLGTGLSAIGMRLRRR